MNFLLASTPVTSQLKRTIGSILMSASANGLTSRFVFPLIAVVGRCYLSSRFYRYDATAWLGRLFLQWP